MERPNGLDTFAVMAEPVDEPLYAATGRRLRLLRLAIHEMDNQRLFAEMHGFTHTQWNNFERGTSRPKPEDALRMKQKFQITTDWIYDGTEAMMPMYLVQKMREIEQSERGAPIKKRRPRSA